MRRTRLAIAGVALGMMASTSIAQDTGIGSDAYTAACAVCHGSNGKGGGEFADILTVKPPDLTMLKAKNDGVFPYLDVFQIVDGRTSIRAHGTSAMPIWGNTFKQEVGDFAGPFGSELLVRARTTALVDYIESIQQ
ncbi:cytochrome c [Devosia sp. PTR5]|uniref:Cytochrome c n=1 Tax=Devosia oryzisoli TaxID=2774138 RepID=A0A927IS33_9HYPH|nr:cytochrome c [Devosia oryzisoli]MBD8064321.1 cytochrome c [Devosia oryzisoli]